MSPTLPAGDKSTNISAAEFAIGARSCSAISDYGGSGAGSIDNNPALVAALAAQNDTNNKCIEFGAGHYYFASDPSIALNSGQTLTVRGLGSGVTHLNFGASNGFSITYADQSVATHWIGLSLETNQIGGYTGITLTQEAAELSPAYAALNTFDDVVGRGADGFAEDDYWGTFINIRQVSNINFTNLSIFGTSTCGACLVPGWTSLGTGVAIAGALYGDNPNNFAVVYNFIGAIFGVVGTPISYGPYVQGVTIVSSNFTGCHAGVNSVSAPNYGTLDQLAIADSQFNCDLFAVFDGAGITNVTIHDNSILLPATSTAGIQLNCAGCDVHDNTFESLNGLGATNAVVIMQTSNGYSGLIHSNYCNSVSTCVFLQENSARIKVYGNSFQDVTNEVADSGSGNIVSDLTECRVGFTASAMVVDGLITHC